MRIVAWVPAFAGMTLCLGWFGEMAEDEERTTMQVGFIGLGIMGASMASNLQKAGYKLVVHDLQRQNAGAHIASGAQGAATPKAVAEACEAVFTSLPGPAEFGAVALATDGLAEGFKKGSALFALPPN